VVIGWSARGRGNGAAGTGLEAGLSFTEENAEFAMGRMTGGCARNTGGAGMPTLCWAGLTAAREAAVVVGRKIGGAVTLGWRVCGCPARGPAMLDAQGMWLCGRAGVRSVVYNGAASLGGADMLKKILSKTPENTKIY